MSDACNSARSIFLAAIEATEEAIINSMIAAQDMIGYKGVSAKALPHQKLQEILATYNRMQ